MTNSCTFTGRLVSNPKIFEGEVSRAEFTLAVDKDFVPKNGEKTADYLDFVAWRDKAEYVARRFHKGDLIQVVNARAKVKQNEEDGVKHRKIEFEVDKVYCLVRDHGSGDER